MQSYVVGDCTKHQLTLRYLTVASTWHKLLWVRHCRPFSGPGNAITTYGTAVRWLTTLQADVAYHTIDSAFLQPDYSASAQSGFKTCLVLLNFTLPKLTTELWRQDGGTNRLYDSLPGMLGAQISEAEAVRQRFLPHAIVGDLDSIRPDVRSFHLARGVAVVDESHDQDTTDIVKCLRFLEQHVLCDGLDKGTQAQGQPRGNGLHAGQWAGEASQHEAAAWRAATQAGTEAALRQALPSSNPSTSASPAVPTPHQVIVLGALGGRLDHMLSNLNALYQFPHLHITLWGEGNLVRLLQPGTTRIRPARGREGPACGLVPLGADAACTTSGLRWNLHNTVMRVGGLISTSNKVQSDEVWVTTDRQVLWMTQVKER